MKVSAAVSDARGTTLPRSGFFFSVHVPQYRAAVISSELFGAASDSETRASSWSDQRGYLTAQTSAPSLHADWLVPESWPQAAFPFIRGIDAAHVFFSGGEEPTDSPWRELRRTLAPLHAAADAVLENIHDTLEPERELSARRRHAGLTAVAQLTEALELTRPVILRMGGVPASTFYAWQKNPQSVIRTPTIVRLLQLQAQIGTLDEALGRERMRAWVLSPERFDRLQGDNDAFARVLAEAGTALTEATRIRPRPRMRHTDYTEAAEGGAY